MADTNIWSDDWGAQAEDWSGGGALSKRLVPGGPFLGASLYELASGTFGIYHVHHGSDELLIVLRGHPTLRTPAGERRLEPGEVVHFPPGPEGAHGIRNDGEEPVRIVMVGTRVSPEVVEYPDLGQMTTQSRHPTAGGKEMFVIHTLEEDA